MLVVGLTGGIGSGKTQVSDWFAQQGICIIDADVLARDVVAKGSQCLNQIAEKFGRWVIDEHGELNRPAMREFVFNNPNALSDLEKITHPAIRQRANYLLEQSTSLYTIVSAPLLLESSNAGLLSLCQRILVVDVSEAIQLQRASQRDEQTLENIQKIMANQLSREARLQKADDVIDNNGSLEQLYEQLPPLHQKYLALANQL